MTLSFTTPRRFNPAHKENAMHPRPLNLARRSFLVRGVEMAGLATLTAVAGRSAPAAAKAAKSDFMYQDHQHDGKSCAQCKFFSPDRTIAASGSCSIVAGAISPHGWCAAFAPTAPG
jgi:hypothetical protein